MFCCTPLVAPAEIRGFDCGRMIDRAREMANIDLKEFLDLTGISAPAWVRQRQGKGPDHISFDRLTRLPARFWLWLVVALLVHFALFPQIEDAIASQVAGVVRRLVGTDRSAHSEPPVSALQEGSTKCAEQSSRSVS